LLSELGYRSELTCANNVQKKAADLARHFVTAAERNRIACRESVANTDQLRYEFVRLDQQTL